MNAHRGNGLRGILLGIFVTLMILCLPEVAAWAVTDLAIGVGFPLLVLLFLLAAVPSPFRCKRRASASLSGFAAGAAWTLLLFIIIGGDLAGRDDRLFAIACVIAVGIPAGKFLIGPFLIYLLSRCYLALFPSGSFLIEVAGIGLGRARGLSSPFPPTLPGWGIRVWERALDLLGREPARSYAIEKGYRHAVDRTSRAVRRKLVSGTDPDHEILRLATLEAGELHLRAMTRSALGLPEGRSESWVSRAIFVWDLVRFAERASGKVLTDARRLLLSPAASLAALPAKGGSKTSGIDSRPNLSQAFSTAASGEANLHIAEFLLSGRWDQLDEETFFAGVVVADNLIDAGFAPLALEIIGRIRNSRIPGWGAPSVARLQLGAEEALLRHVDSLETSTAAVRKTRRTLAALSADAPELQRPAPQILKATFTAALSSGERRNPSGLKGMEQPGFDPGTGRTATAFALVLVCGWYAWSVLSCSPMGIPVKNLRDLYHRPPYRGHPITSADMDPRDGSLILGSLGGGVHQIDTSTFRVRTFDSGSGKLSSDFIPSVAVGQDGTLLAMTLATGSHFSPDSRMETRRPPSSGADLRGTGVDVRNPSGKWFPLIEPWSIPDLGSATLEAVTFCGKDRILLVSGRLLIYHAASRKLQELKPISGDRFPQGERAMLIAGSRTDPHGFWAATSGGTTFGGTTFGRVTSGARRLFRITLIPEGSPKRSPRGSGGVGSFSSAESPPDDFNRLGISRIEVRGETLWVRTPEGYLFRFQDGALQFILGAEPDLDLTRVIDAVCVDGPRPALWILEGNGSGGIRKIRMRSLVPGSLVPATSWVSCDFPVRLGSETPDLLAGGELAVGNSAPYPWGRWNAFLRRHELLIPGSDSGLVVFSGPADPVSSTQDALLNIGFVSTPNEKVVWLDGMENRLAMILESRENRERRVVLADVGADIAGSLAKSRELQRTSIPYGSDFGGDLLLVHRIPRFDGFMTLSTGGLIHLFDARMRGWTSFSGLKIGTAEGWPDPITSADARDSKIVFTDSLGKVVEVPLEDEIDLESRLRHPQERASGTRPLFATPIHFPTPRHPSPALEPRAVATEEDGIVLFMGGSSEASPVDPWRFRFEGPKGSIISWIQEGVKSGKMLHPQSITRLVEGDLIHGLIALDTDGALHYRSGTDWVPGRNPTDIWKKIIQGDGGTFLRGQKSLSLLSISEGVPTIGPFLWQEGKEAVSLPVSAVTGLRDPDGNQHLLVGHRKGLSTYDLAKRVWTSLRLEDPASRTGVPETWRFTRPMGEGGMGTFSWACRTSPSKVSTLFEVRPGNARFRFQDPSLMTLPLGENMVVGVPGKSLFLLRPDGADKILVEDGPSEGGTRNLVRAACTTTGDVWALDEWGGVYRLVGPSLRQARVTIPNLGGTLKDLDSDSGGGVAGLDYSGNLRYCPAGSDSAIIIPGPPFQKIQAVGKHLVAASLDRGELVSIDNGRKETIAGGENPLVTIGEPFTAFGDNDGLWIAGNLGAAFRDPSTRRFVGIRDGAGISRFEKVGEAMVAWKASEPFFLGSSPLEIPLIPTNARAVFQGPGDTLMGLGGDPTHPTLINLRQGSPHPTRLFKYSIGFRDRIQDVAPIGPHSFCVKTGSGDLAIYDIWERSLELVLDWKHLPQGWRFLSLGDDIFLVPGAQFAGDVFRVSAETPFPTLIGTAANGALKTEDSIAWIGINGEIFKTDSTRKFFSFDQSGPAERQIVDRLRKAAAGEGLEEPPSPSSISLGGFGFIRDSGGWLPVLNGRTIPIIDGRLAIDIIESAQSWQDHSGITLYLLVGNPRFIVKQTWNELNRLGVPDLVVSDGSNRGIAFPGLQAEAFPQGTLPPIPFPSVSSRWRFDLSTRAFFFSEKPVETLPFDQGICFAADRIASETEDDGSPSVRSDGERLFYRSVTGEWYAWDREVPISLKAARIPPPEPGFLNHTISGARFQRRSGPESNFLWGSRNLPPTGLPWKVVDGRFPHERIRRIAASGSNELLCELEAPGIWRTFKNPGRNPDDWEFHPPPSELPQDSWSEPGQGAASLTQDVAIAWELSGDAASFSLERADPTSGAKEKHGLGRLSQKGFAIDDPENVVPIAVREGELKFTFDGSIWKRSLPGDLASFRKLGPVPDGNPELVTWIDGATGKVVSTFSSAIPTDHIPSPLLGRFSEIGRHLPERSACLIPGESPERVSLGKLVGSSGKSFGTTIFRDSLGWVCTLERPKAAVIGPGERLILLGMDGSSVGRWRETAAGFECEGIGSFSEAATIRSLWRHGEEVAAELEGASSPRVLGFRESGEPFLFPAGSTVEETVPGLPGFFHFRRMRPDGRLAAFSEDGTSRELKGLPGVLPQRIHFTEPDRIFLSYKLENEVRKTDNTDSSGTLPPFVRGHLPPLPRRILGRLMISDPKESVEVVPQAGAPWLRIDIPEETVVARRIGAWEVRQDLLLPRIDIRSSLGESDPGQSLLPPPIPGETRTRLLVDCCLDLVPCDPDIHRGVFPFGVEILGSGTGVLFGEHMSRIASGAGSVLRQPSGEAFFRIEGSGPGISLETGKETGIPSDAHDLGHLEPGNGWAFFRAGDTPTLVRTAPGNHGPAIDTMVGSEIFSEGQMAFDRVLGVFWDPGSVEGPFFSTPRGIEKVFGTDTGPETRIITDSSLFAALGSGTGLSQRAVPPQEHRAGEQHGKWIFPSPIGGEFRFPGNPGPPEERKFPFNQVPLAFRPGKRFWAVFSDGVFWVELSERWKQFTLDYFRQTPSSSAPNALSEGWR